MQRTTQVINIDITFVIQLINFLISLLIINFLIIRPIRFNMHKRRGLVHDDIEKAKYLTEKADKQFRAYEEHLQKIRRDVAGTRLIAKEDGDEKAQAMLADAEKHSHTIRTEASIFIKEERGIVQEELEKRVPQFVQLALAKLFA